MALQVVVTTPRSRCAINGHFYLATTVAIIARGAKCIKGCLQRHNSTQLNSTSSWVELCRYKHPLKIVHSDRSCISNVCDAWLQYLGLPTLNFEAVPVDHFKHKSYQL